LALIAGRILTVRHLDARKNNARVDTDRPGDQAENDDGADAHAAGAARQRKTRSRERTVASAVFDIIALAEIVPTHLLCLQPRIKGPLLQLSVSAIVADL
jgi:hypothetical protein